MTVPASSASAPSELVGRARGALLDFYDAHRRRLPWRDDPRPYRVWIAEVMLQQTRVSTVLPYYRAWMERFPDVGTLANAPLDDVLKAWEGLGYYARARSLHRAAHVLRDRMGCELPGDAASLKALPGFGEYTSGAVASIAFGEAVPAVDGNARRVLARLYDEAAPSARWLRERAAELIDPVRPGDFNQALMELGATVCAPRAPRCSECPLASDCLVRARGTALERPMRRPRRALLDVEFGVAALVRGGPDTAPELLLVRRPEQGLLGGLWELPGEEVGGGPERVRPRSARRAAKQAAVALGLAPGGAPVPLPVVRQAFSHFRGIYRPFLWTVAAADGCEPPVGSGMGDGGANIVWVDREGLAARALPHAQRRIAEGALEVSSLRRPSRTAAT